MVFLFLFRQALRQPVTIFANNVFYFLRYWQKLQRLSGCYRKAVTILAAQSSSSRQPLLSRKPLYSFRLHYTTGFAALNTFRSIPATFVSAAFSLLLLSLAKTEKKFQTVSMLVNLLLRKLDY